MVDHALWQALSLAGVVDVEDDASTTEDVASTAVDGACVEEALETPKKARKGKDIVTRKQKMGMPRLVHFLKKLGACPCSARPYSVRVPQ